MTYKNICATVGSKIYFLQFGGIREYFFVLHFFVMDCWKIRCLLSLGCLYEVPKTLKIMISWIHQMYLSIDKCFIIKFNPLWHLLWILASWNPILKSLFYPFKGTWPVLQKLKNLLPDTQLSHKHHPPPQSHTHSQQISPQPKHNQTWSYFIA